MSLSRRQMMGATVAVAGLAAQSGRAAAAPAAKAAPSLPDKTSFVPMGVTYLDSGSFHPLSIAGKAEMEAYLRKREFDPHAAQYELPEKGVRAKFAKLINAPGADDIAYVQSTTIGEEKIIRGLGLPEGGGHVVTDTLHFFGSLPMYEQLQKQGCEVTFVPAKDGRIRLEDMKAAIRKDTKLVSLSLVSTINGFEHDLKAVCDIAHARGALVYADIIHAAGCVPVDVQASGVDFAASASYKWLMGDFGLGFIYARKESRHRLMRRDYSYYGISEFRPHIYPYDPPGKDIIDYAYADTAEGKFAHGTYAHTVVALLDHSLDYIMQLGVPAIQAHAQTLTDHLKKELPRMGYAVMTPPEARTPIVACAYKDPRKRLGPRMKAANIRITMMGNRFRITPSVFNDEADIERFLSVLGRA